MKSPNPIDVICIGSATVDHILPFDGSFSQQHQGDKVLLSSRALFTGGGATNSAACLANCGLRSAVITKLGDDHDAQFIIDELEQRHIPLLTNKRSSQPTSSSYILVSSKDHDRIIYTYKGASNDLTLKDFSLTQLKPKFFYLATLTGKAFPTAVAVAKYAIKHKIPLLFNPSTYLAKQGAKVLAPILKCTSILVLNKQEAQLVTKNKNKDVHKLLLQLQRYGPPSVIITDGPRAVTALIANTFHTIMPPDAKVLDTAGAGDAFAATYLAMKMRGHTVHDALRAAAKNSVSVIQHHGPKTGLLDYKKLVK